MLIKNIWKDQYTRVFYSILAVKCAMDSEDLEDGRYLENLKEIENMRKVLNIKTRTSWEKETLKKYQEDQF